jgi:N-acetylglucosamine-6-sulfatase
MLKKHLQTGITGVLALQTALCAAGAPAQTPAPQRPNVIFILSDDHRYDAMGFLKKYPWLQTPNMDRMAGEGVYYKNAFVTISVCAPSRASFLTGMYPHTHGVASNQDERECNWDKTPSFGQYLHDAGYRTGYIGKWHMDHSNHNRPGWDFWASFSDQGKYFDNHITVNGENRFEPDYVTDVLTRYAVEFLETDDERPFLLYLSHKAVHAPFTPAERHRELYRDQHLPDTANRTYDLAGKPDWQRRASPQASVFVNQRIEHAAKLPVTGPPSPHFEQQFLDYSRTLKAVDESIGTIFQTLEKQGRLDNTLIIYAGDNGFMFGEHRRGDKRVAYEESIRIPLLMRWPNGIPAGRVVSQQVLNIDVAPTLLELAGCTPPQPAMQGQSLCRLWTDENAPWRDSFLYTYFRDLQPVIPTLVGYRTERCMLVNSLFREGDLQELYDLKKDPQQLSNLYYNPEYEAVRKQLEQGMQREKARLNYVADVPEPCPERFRTPPYGELFNYKNTKQSRQHGSSFKADSQVKYPAARELVFTEPVFRIRMNFTAHRDGIIASQGDDVMGYIAAISGGKLRFILFRGPHRYILESSQSVLARPCEAVAEFDNGLKIATLRIDDQPEQSLRIANTYPRDFHTKGTVTLGRTPDYFKELQRVGLNGESFTGDLHELMIERTPNTAAQQP